MPDIASPTGAKMVIMSLRQKNTVLEFGIRKLRNRRETGIQWFHRSTWQLERKKDQYAMKRPRCE